jgi:hypothetical protein
MDEALPETDYRQKLRAFDTQIAAVGGEGRLDPSLFQNW